MLDAVIATFARAASLGVLFLATVGATGPGVALNAVSSIDVRSAWLGLPGESDLYQAIISRHGNRFVSNNSYKLTMLNKVKQSASKHDLVPNGGVMQLLEAIAGPIKPHPIPRDFGATPRWLSMNSESAFQSFMLNVGGESEGFFTPEQRSLYLSAFQNTSLLSVALLAYYSGPQRTDDDIEVTATIHLRDGRQLVADSQSQRTLMLPWSVSLGGTIYKSFDPVLSAAIRALLPTQVVRYHRLSPDQLLTELPDIVGQQISSEWNKLPPYDLSPTLSSLERQFSVRITHGSTTDAKPAWSAELHWPDLPQNVSALVNIPIVNNAFGSTAAIPAARRFADMVIGIPWVKQTLKDHPELALEVLMEHSDSIYLTTDQQSQLLSDLKAMGRTDIIAQVQYAIPNSFVVMFTQPKTFSTWVVMPSQDMVLWDYYDSISSLPILDLTLEQLGGRRCPDRDFLCSGLLRAPDGSIVSGKTQ